MDHWVKEGLVGIRSKQRDGRLIRSECEAFVVNPSIELIHGHREAISSVTYHDSRLRIVRIVGETDVQVSNRRLVRNEKIEEVW